jgi:hypothetical protein
VLVLKKHGKDMSRKGSFDSGIGMQVFHKLSPTLLFCISYFAVNNLDLFMSWVPLLFFNNGDPKNLFSESTVR